MIEIKDIHKSFGDNNVLRGISARFNSGDNNLIIGGSWVGKNTHLTLIGGLPESAKGLVLLDGRGS